MMAPMKVILVAVALLLAGCGSTAPPKDLGCASDLGGAENTYDQQVSGIGTTATISDAAAGLATVKSDLDDLATVSPDSTVKQKAADASMLAGRIRVALVDGGGLDAVSASDVTALHADIKALDARCVALGM